jgi:hypothetical protein
MAANVPALALRCAARSSTPPLPRRAPGARASAGPPRAGAHGAWGNACRLADLFGPRLRCQCRPKGSCIPKRRDAQPAWLGRLETARVAARPGRAEADKFGEGRHAFLVYSLFVCAEVAQDLPELGRECGRECIRACER